MAIKIDKNLCTGCYACVTVCPEAAIFVRDKKAEADNKLCVNCGMCQQECLEKAIVILAGKDLGGGGY